MFAGAPFVASPDAGEADAPERFDTLAMGRLALGLIVVAFGSLVGVAAAQSTATTIDESRTLTTTVATTVTEPPRTTTVTRSETAPATTVTANEPTTRTNSVTVSTTPTSNNSSGSNCRGGPGC